jgi:hypothetical protein
MMPLVDTAMVLSSASLAVVSVSVWDRMFCFSNDMESAAFATLARTRRGRTDFFLSMGSWLRSRTRLMNGS